MRFSLICASSVFVALLGTGCGGKSKGGSGGDAPNQENVGDDASKEGIFLDVTELQLLNSNLSAVSSADGPHWDFRLSVNGEERFNLSVAKIEDVSAALEATKLQHFDVVRSEITVSGNDKVLATNMESVAAGDENLKKIWDAECASAVDPEVTVDESEFLLSYEGNSTTISLKVCDFSGFTTKPTVTIAGHKQYTKPRTVIYHCQFSVKHSYSNPTDYIYTYDNSHCGYGYAALEGEAMPKIEILEEYAPGTPLYNQRVLRLSSFRLKTGNAGQYQLVDDFYSLPFGSHSACHTTKVDVKYATDSGVKVARLEFKRNTSGNGMLWMPQDAGNWPDINLITDYYRRSGGNEKVNLYRICEWLPEASDVESGNIMVVSGG